MLLSFEGHHIIHRKMTTKTLTLADVSRTTKRNRAFAGKPRPIKSGHSIMKVPPMVHRSDVLLDEQIELVRGIQDDLKRAVEAFAHFKTEKEMMYWKTQVDQLRARSEEMVLILKVVSKLRRELVYAKLELEQVIKEGEDATQVRKRVVWLEGRVEALLCRCRQDEHCRSSLESSGESFKQSDMVLLPTPNNNKLKESSSSKDVEYNYHAEVPKSGNCLYGGGDAGVNLHASSERKDGGTPMQGVGPEVILTSPFDAVEDNNDDDYLEGYSASFSEDNENDDKEHMSANGSVFITEAAISEGASSQRKIHFSPDTCIEKYDEQFDDEDEDAEKDAVTRYWESPHHKFEFSEQRQTIMKDNPLSYHNLGLALSSSFIEQAPATPSELPWRPSKKSSDMGDAQKIALDKLSERIHDIRGKMEDAALQSVEFHRCKSKALDKRPESCLSTSSPAFRPQLKTRKSTHSATRTGADSSQSRSAAASIVPSHMENLPPVERPRHMSVVPMLTYHPPVIPIPEVLPIPRTSTEKQYPRISSNWNETHPEDMCPTIRLVNQMNVAKETKISLYKKKDKNTKELAAKSHHATGLQWKIASDPLQTTAEVAAIVSNRKKNRATQLERSSLQWARIQVLLQNLVSQRVEERRDAAMHLGVLDCNDTDVLTALTSSVQNDSDNKVKYNAAKSMISLGHWSETALTIIVNCMKDGTYQMQSDLVKTIMNARNVHNFNKTSTLGKQLIAKLTEHCSSKKDKSNLGFDSAICLCCIGVRTPVVKLKLMTCLQSKDTNLVIKSLEVLVRQLGATEPAVVRMVLHQLQRSVAWKHRVSAAKLLVLIGAHYLLVLEEPDAVFKILEQRLFDDPSREVRQEVAVSLTSLGMRGRVVDLVEKRLEDDDDDTRAHAVTAVGVLGMKADRIIRILLEMLELDSCEYVRLQVIRTFSTLGTANVKIMRVLRERERMEGPLAREAAKALTILSSGHRTAVGAS